MRCGDVLAVLKSHVGVAQVVGDDEENVGFLGRSGHRIAGQREDHRTGQDKGFHGFGTGGEVRFRVVGRVTVDVDHVGCSGTIFDHDWTGPCPGW